MKYKLSLTGRATSDDPADNLESDLDAVMDELELLDVEDPFVYVDENTNDVSFELVVAGDTIDEAFGLAMSALRSALHAAGIGTPGWGAASRKSVEITSQGLVPAC